MELEWLFGLIVVLAVIGIFGLGIWTLLAAIYRAIRGQSPVGNSVDRIRCPWCGLKNPATERRCQWCGKLLNIESTGEAADLAALRRQLARLQESGVLDAATLQDLLVRVTAYERERSQPGVIGQAAASTPRSPQTQPATPPGAPLAACPPASPPHGQQATRGTLVAELVPEPTLAPPTKVPAVLSPGQEQSGPISCAAAEDPTGCGGCSPRTGTKAGRTATASAQAVDGSGR